MKIKERIIHIDGFNLFYRMFTTYSTVDFNGEPNGGYVGFMQNLRDMISLFNPSHTIVYFDGSEAGLRRRQIYPDYKGKKARKKRFSYLKFGDEEDAFVEAVDNEEQQLLMIFELLRLMPVSVIQVDYYEADDIIAYLSKKADEYDNIIISNDKDYLQLVTDNISVYTPTSKVLYTPNEVQSRFGLLKQNYLYARLVEGDASDKIKGVDGVALKSLIKLIPQLKNEPIETFDQFWKQIENLQGKGKKIQTLKESKDLLFRNYKICDLNYVNISQRALDTVKKYIEVQKDKPFSSIKLKTFMVKNKINHHIRNYDMWVRPFFLINTNTKFNI